MDPYYCQDCFEVVWHSYWITLLAGIFVAAQYAVAYEKNLDTYIEYRQKLIAEENDKFLGTVWNFLQIIWNQMVFKNFYK